MELVSPASTKDISLHPINVTDRLFINVRYALFVSATENAMI